MSCFYENLCFLSLVFVYLIYLVYLCSVKDKGYLLWLINIIFSVV